MGTTSRPTGVAIVGALTSDGRNGPTVDDELGAVDRGGTIRGQVGDEVGDLEGFGAATYGNAAKAGQYELARVLDGATAA